MDFPQESEISDFGAMRSQIVRLAKLYSLSDAEIVALAIIGSCSTDLHDLPRFIDCPAAMRAVEITNFDNENSSLQDATRSLIKRKMIRICTHHDCAIVEEIISVIPRSLVFCGVPPVGSLILTQLGIALVRVIFEELVDSTAVYSPDESARIVTTANHCGSCKLLNVGDRCDVCDLTKTAQEQTLTCDIADVGPVAFRSWDIRSVACQKICTLRDS